VRGGAAPRTRKCPANCRGVYYKRYTGSQLRLIRVFTIPTLTSAILSRSTNSPTMRPQPRREVREVDTCPVSDDQLPTSPDGSKTASEAHIATCIEAHLAAVDQPLAPAKAPTKPQMELSKQPISTPQPSSLPPGYEKGEPSDSKRPPAQASTKRSSFLGSARRTSSFGGKLRKEQSQQSGPTMQEEEDRNHALFCVAFLY
jgi:hypothetical protein